MDKHSKVDKVGQRIGVHCFMGKLCDFKSEHGRDVKTSVAI